VKNSKIEKGFVYIFEAVGQGFYKIGRTHYLMKRLQAIKTSSPSKIRYVFAAVVDDPVQVEKALHLLFKDLRVTGEWFMLGTKDVKRVITLIQLANFDLVCRQMKLEDDLNVFELDCLAELDEAIDDWNEIKLRLEKSFIESKEVTGLGDFERRDKGILPWEPHADPRKLIYSARPQIVALVQEGMSKPFQIAKEIWGDVVDPRSSPYAGKKGVKFLIEQIVKRGIN